MAKIIDCQEVEFVGFMEVLLEHWLSILGGPHLFLPREASNNSLFLCVEAYCLLSLLLDAYFFTNMELVIEPYYFPFHSELPF